MPVCQDTPWTLLKFLVATGKDLLTTWPFVLFTLSLIFRKSIREGTAYVPKLFKRLDELLARVKAIEASKKGIRLELDGGTVRDLPNPDEE